MGESEILRDRERERREKESAIRSIAWITMITMSMK